jgi:NADH-quinone oxidoreductase subunit L
MSIGMQQSWLLTLIPLTSFLIVSLFGKKLPRQGDWIVVLSGSLCFLITLLIIGDFQSFFHGHGFEPVGNNIYNFDWINIPNYLLIEYSTFVDAITVVMLFVVSLVGLMVIIYSIGYMQGEQRYHWYFSLLAFFLAAMFTLITTGNLLQLYLAWEGVGLGSYLLIGFYWEKQSAAEAAKKAFITTRIGDVGLLIGIIMLWRVAGTFDIQTIIQLAQESTFSDGYLTTAMIFLFFGAVGKSAQFPLHVWLPDAMEGPTPVSALIHAATMVVAGVYLVSRMLPIYTLLPIAQNLILITGLITALLAATMGLLAQDIKKVLAYSTVSQLGYMFVALGVGSLTAAMFHLFTHAFFKALLFLGSGSVIHATHKQDISQLGGLKNKMPITFVTFSIGALSLAGIPPLSGFWSKDEILLYTSEFGAIFYGLLLFAALLTAIYSTRLVILTFFGTPKDQEANDHAHESPKLMSVPLLILAFFATVSGFFIFPFVGNLVGFDSGFSGIVYLDHPHDFHIELSTMLVAISVSLLGVLIGYLYWLNADGRRAENAKEWAPEVRNLLLNNYYFDNFYQAIINKFILGLASIIAWFDDQVVNRSGIDGSAQIINYIGFRLKFLQTGKIPNYVLMMALGIILFSFIMVVNY